MLLSSCQFKGANCFTVALPKGLGCLAEVALAVFCVVLFFVLMFLVPSSLQKLPEGSYSVSFTHEGYRVMLCFFEGRVFLFIDYLVFFCM